VASPDLTFALVPMVNDASSGMAIAAFCDVAGRAAGVRFVPRLARSPEALASLFASRGADVAWVSPTLLLTAPALADAVPLACAMREGVTWYHGVIFVRRDSAIRSPLDLQGKRMAWVAPSSSSGYIFPRVALAGLGVDPTTLFAEERFHQSHDAVVHAVLDGRADAGAVFAVFEEGNATRPLKRSAVLSVGRAEEARILLPSAPVASDLIVASPSAARRVPDLAEAFQKLGDSPGVSSLMSAAFNAERFASVDLGALAELRRQVQDARALGVL
jgi:ABC-type phosphate/phosphonate transport system substrate-binding protein